MADIVKTLGDQLPVECQATKCSGAGCSLKLNNLPKPYVLIDMDCKELEHPTGNRCDFIFISGEDVINKKDAWIVPIELKSGRLDASQVIKQLQSGSNFAASIMPQNVRVQFIPIAAHGGRAHSREIKKLRQQRIRFRQIQAQIKLTRCGRSLSEQLR